MEKEKLVSISPNDWHYKLVKYCWGIRPEIFMNLCPYFWLTIASLFCVIPVSIWKGIKWGFFKFLDWADRVGTEYEEKKYKVSFLDSLSNAQIYYLKYHRKPDAGVPYDADELSIFKVLTNCSKGMDAILSDVMRKRGITKKDIQSYRGEFEQQYSLMKDRRQHKLLKKQASEEAAKNREKQVKKTMNGIASFTKSIFQFLYVMVIGFIVFIIASGISDLCCWAFSMETDRSEFYKALLYMISLILTCILCLAISGFSEGWSKEKETIHGWKWALVIPSWCLYFPVKWILYSFLWKGICVWFIWRIICVALIGGILLGFKEGLVEFGGIFSSYFDASYSDYCPGINWEEKK